MSERQQQASPAGKILLAWLDDEDDHDLEACKAEMEHIRTTTEYRDWQCGKRWRARQEEEDE